MKIQGTPEEMEQAKNWWKDQKKRIDEEYKEAKKKDKNAKKDTSLVSPENKERTYRRHEVSFSQIKGDKSQKYLDNYLAKHSSQEDDWKKQLDDELTKKVMYRALYRFEGNDREILLMFMQKIPQREIAEKLGISASAVSQRLKILKEDYRIMLCNDPEFKKTKQFRDLKWESKVAFNKCIKEIRRTGKFTINLNDVLDLIQEVKKIIKKTISTGADKNIKQKLSQKIDYSNLDDNWIKQTNKIFADYGIETHFENLKNFKGNFFQVVKMVEDFIEELQEKVLKKEK